MFEYKEATLRELEALWKKNVEDHPGDDRWRVWKEEYIQNHLTGLAKTYCVTKDGEAIGEGTLLFSPACSAIAGVTLLADGKNTVNVNALRMHKEYEGQGHMSKLVKLMESEAKKMGYRYSTIGVDESETRNRAIYRHWNYLKEIYTEIEDGELVLYYQKEL